MKRAKLQAHGNRWLGPMAIGIVLLAAMIAQSLITSMPASAQFPTKPSINAVYLADASNPGVDPAQARARGVRIVGSVQELTAGAATADAIVIDRGAFETVDPQLLMTLSAQGKVIVAINVPGSRLQRATGYPRSDSASDWAASQGRPFYAYVYQQREQWKEYGADGVDIIYDPQSFLNRLYGLTPAGQADSRRVRRTPTSGPVNRP